MPLCAAGAKSPFLRLSRPAVLSGPTKVRARSASFLRPCLTLRTLPLQLCTLRLMLPLRSSKAGRHAPLARYQPRYLVGRSVCCQYARPPCHAQDMPKSVPRRSLRRRKARPLQYSTAFLEQTKGNLISTAKALLTDHEWPVKHMSVHCKEQRTFDIVPPHLFFAPFTFCAPLMNSPHLWAVHT